MNDRLQEPTSPAPAAASSLELRRQALAADMYSAHATMNAATLVGTLGMSEAAALEFVDAVDASVKELGVEERRQVAEGLDGLLSIMRGAIAVSPAEALAAIPEAGGNGSIAPQDEPEAVPATEPATVPDAPESTEPEQLVVPAVSAPTLEEARGMTDKPLNPEQEAWVVRLLGEEKAGLIAALPFAKRMQFAQLLGEKYESINVRRLNPKQKRDRFRYVIGLVSGTSYKEIAAHTSLEENAIKARVEEIADVIRKKVPEEEIIACVPEHMFDGGERPNPVQEENSAWEMSRDQRNWCTKIFDQPGDIDNLEILNSGQRQYLAGKLAEWLRTYDEERSTTTTSDRRADEMTRLLNGDSYEAIAHVTGLTVKKVKQELHSIAITIHDEMLQRDKSALLAEARSYRPDPGTAS